MVFKYQYDEIYFNGDTTEILDKISVLYFMIAKKYKFGLDCDKNYIKSFKYLKLSADLGNYKALNNLGYIFQHNNSESNQNNSFQSYYLSCYYSNKKKILNPIGFNNLAYCYKYGIGCNKDIKRANYYYNLSNIELEKRNLFEKHKFGKALL